MIQNRSWNSINQVKKLKNDFCDSIQASGRPFASKPKSKLLASIFGRVKDSPTLPKIEESQFQNRSCKIDSVFVQNSISRNKTNTTSETMAWNNDNKTQRQLEKWNNNQTEAIEDSTERWTKIKDTFYVLWSRISSSSCNHVVVSLSIIYHLHQVQGHPSYFFAMPIIRSSQGKKTAATVASFSPLHSDGCCLTHALTHRLRRSLQLYFAFSPEPLTFFWLLLLPLLLLLPQRWLWAALSCWLSPSLCWWPSVDLRQLLGNNISCGSTSSCLRP